MNSETKLFYDYIMQDPIWRLEYLDFARKVKESEVGDEFNTPEENQIEKLADLLERDFLEVYNPISDSKGFYSHALLNSLRMIDFQQVAELLLKEV